MISIAVALPTFPEATPTCNPKRCYWIQPGVQTARCTRFAIANEKVLEYGAKQRAVSIEF